MCGSAPAVGGEDVLVVRQHLVHVDASVHGTGGGGAEVTHPAAQVARLYRVQKEAQVTLAAYVHGPYAYPPQAVAAYLAKLLEQGIYVGHV